jgi:hypothetical protein
MVIGMSMMMIAMMIVVMLARSESFAFDTAGSRFSMIRGINTSHPFFGHCALSEHARLQRRGIDILSRQPHLSASR